jgi:hypothetical protein
MIKKFLFSVVLTISFQAKSQSADVRTEHEGAEIVNKKTRTLIFQNK